MDFNYPAELHGLKNKLYLKKETFFEPLSKVYWRFLAVRREWRRGPGLAGWFVFDMTTLLFRQTQLKTPTWWHSTIHTSSSSCAPSLCCLPFPHLSRSPLLSHFDPTTLNPPSTRQHGRQAATQTGDRKQLINILTPLHLPAPIWGGEPSTSTTKQPPRHTQLTHYTLTLLYLWWFRRTKRMSLTSWRGL